MFVTDLAGSVYTARLNGSEKKPVLAAQETSLVSRTLNNDNINKRKKKYYELQQTYSPNRDRWHGCHRRKLAAQYLARGFDVVATDPAPNAEANLRKYVDEAWAATHRH